MEAWMQKYKGSMVELIYSDGAERFTKRVVRILSVHGSYVLAYCTERRAVRSFALGGILAYQPLRGRGA
ncbi:hypothetical protein [Paenibacillus mucilaginosus]|uniref:WYL domain-containing protein n=3 Tax=Paenibacillus mucilaginosus TaxID=61624 RepID=H6NB91_9BACL|nr:hypothetical protein [Paenibacillus mucilaginosus]AEI42518.1 hypothetical protein KNP414_03981 [Paenibacillus mucilaginosus KNP414]AFC32059.1 hypothetical protein PM3016_5356 [Paenibacillus mucilaginosus 3016]AFH64429.1 hypothetical protein B2K_27675 [Paenibacillus mucilaginosus K02]MCG7213911.1 hypothetical protein [Paenibacillus mucilaginosus]WDM25916.1 hypothetical protein KCX80_26220 [Paenibacillus mucilaginosus]